MEKFTRVLKCISVKYWVERIKFSVSEEIHNRKEARMYLERGVGMERANGRDTHGGSVQVTAKLIF